ncbi:amino acid ABC transporter permease [Aurantimonas sp. VKM B-3413]|uniref:amino acid ABC transporter permease n=1 Tax=Aurantimonas sp. VKM B-3413 TaxID=2779401 RepID=UPI001E3541CA|nr:amino acid ABC transporter permease [Aurantimonas sp. VKM B-3413]MCB8840281.1 amino acid ABC transporter permease [Aurantimonas sp. VKM B-3413]
MGFLDTFFNTDVMLRVFPMLIAGLKNTLLLAVTTLIIGSIGGIILCILRLYAPKPLAYGAVAIIDIFRALPILVVLVLVYYALPFMGVRLSSFTSAVFALALVLSAFTAEVFRAGIQAIPAGQTEAARSLGMHFPAVLWKVILPQALRIATPPHTSNCVAIAKDTSLASVVAMPDLLKQATDAQALTANPSPLIAAALMYLIILWPAVRMVSLLEKRFTHAR